MIENSIDLSSGQKTENCLAIGKGVIDPLKISIGDCKGRVNQTESRGFAQLDVVCASIHSDRLALGIKMSILDSEGCRIVAVIGT